MVRRQAGWCFALLLASASLARAQTGIPVPPASTPTNPPELVDVNAGTLLPEQAKGQAAADASERSRSRIAFVGGVILREVHGIPIAP